MGLNQIMVDVSRIIFSTVHVAELGIFHFKECHRIHLRTIALIYKSLTRLEHVGDVQKQVRQLLTQEV